MLGKSTTIVALLLQIFALKDGVGQRPRVLLTAPSNAAADELLRKLKAIAAPYPSGGRTLARGGATLASDLRMVRIGNLRAIHREVRDYR